jgi:hypothetical protein
MAASSALGVAYDLRLPDYVDGTKGARRLAHEISDVLTSFWYQEAKS